MFKQLKARDLILKILEVVVFKLKSIAKYQVTHLLEPNNNNNSDETCNNNEANSSMQTKEKVENGRRELIEKLDTFLNSFEDKDKVKVLN